MSNEIRYEQGQNKKGIEKDERNRDNKKKKPTLSPELYRERNKKNQHFCNSPPFQLPDRNKKKGHE